MLGSEQEGTGARFPVASRVAAYARRRLWRSAYCRCHPPARGVEPNDGTTRTVSSRRGAAEAPEVRVDHVGPRLEAFAADRDRRRLASSRYSASGLVPISFAIVAGGTAVPGGKPIERSPVILRFNVRDVEATAELLKARGVHVSIRREVWGTVGDFVDPDGNQCALRDEGSFLPSVG